MFKEKIKIILKILGLLFYAIIFLEIFARFFIFFITLNLNIFLYGFNNNIGISSHSFKKFEFYVYNNKASYKKKHNTKLNENKIWVFGGSTSNRGFCDSVNISWVDLLKKNLNNISNFSRNGVYSDYSLKVLLSQLQKNNPPKIIIWANKVNELRFAKLNSNKNITYNIKSLNLTFKRIFVSYYLLDEMLLRISQKIGIKPLINKETESEEDLINSAENFYNNTKKAIKISQSYNVNNFYVVSIFNNYNLKNDETKFYKFYIDKVKKLTNEFNIGFIDTKKYLNNDQKKLKLFCDPMHQTLLGKEITAQIIFKKLNEH